jgi:hypothetical protein
MDDDGEAASPWMPDDHDSDTSRRPYTAVWDLEASTGLRFKVVTQSTRPGNRLRWKLWCDDDENRFNSSTVEGSFRVGKGKLMHALPRLNAHLQALGELEQQPLYHMPGATVYPSFGCTVLVKFDAPRSNVRHRLNVWLLQRYL